MRRRFTEPDAFSHVFGVHDLSDESLRRVARSVRVTSAPGELPSRERVAREIASSQRVAAALESLPEAALAALAALVDAGGELSFDELEDALRERWGFAGAFADSVVLPLERELLALVLGALDDPGVELLSLIREAALPVAEHCRGLDLPSAGAPAWESSPLRRDERDLLAMASALAHMSVSITQSGTVHRGKSKRFTRELGMDPALFEGLVLRAHCAGLVVVDQQGVLLPSVVALRAVAEGGLAGDGPLATCAQAWLTHEPVPAEPFYRAVLNEVDRAGLWRYHGEPGNRRTDACRRDASRVAGLAIATVDGVEWLGRRPAAGGVGDGYVTPSFQVLLGPGATAQAVFEVGLCARLVKLDQVVTLELTRASVAAAVDLGLSADEILAALARVGRHAVPENVNVSVRDWAAGATSAVTLAEGSFVFVPPGSGGSGSREQAKAALGDWLVREPVPGAFLLAPGVSALLAQGRLEKAGVRVARAAVRSPLRSAFSPGPAVELTASASPSLRARMQAWRKAGAPGSPSADDEPTEYLEELAACASRVDRWIATLPAGARRAAAENTTRLSLILRLIGLEPSQREPAFAASRTVKALKRTFDRLLDHSGHPASALALLDPEGWATLGADLPTSLERVAITPPAVAGSAPPAASGRYVSSTRVEIAQALADAALSGGVVMLDLARGDSVAARIDRVTERGSETVVLGSETESDDSFAWPLHQVLGVTLPSRAAKQRWTPSREQPAPPLGAPCPCGSGKRYKKCCRPR